MPIPQLTRSPQTWRRQRAIIRKRRHQGLGALKRKRLFRLRLLDILDNLFISLTGREFLRKKRRSFFKFLFKTAFILSVIIVLIGGIASAGAIAWFSRNLPGPDRIIKRALAESTKIYDRTGETILYEIHGEEKRTMVELNELPPYVKWTTITIEDQEFYQHQGFNFRGIIRAFLYNLFHGGKIQGGSSITQQFIKNAVLTGEKTYTRKIKELVLAYRIEQKFTKDEILKMYFNEIPYGSTAYGIEAASQTYLGKSARDLTLAEAAVLAALPKAPTYYSPWGSHRDELLARQKYILGLMAKEGYISHEEAEAAKGEKIEFKTKRESILAPHFVMYIKELLTEKYGEREVEHGGLKVYTTLDLYKQKIAEEAVKAGAERNLKKYKASNAALVALDPKTGQILAMVGSKDFYDEAIDGQVNVTLQPRQPGSSFKPIVYAAAFEKGYTPETIIYDVLTTFKTEIGKDYEPHNYNDKNFGPVTIRQALAGSLNIPAVKTIYLTGINNVLNLAEKMGYTTFGDRSRFGLSLVLGGGEVKLLEHTSAFGAFAREGDHYPWAAILKVEDKNGNILEEWRQPKVQRVLNRQIARQINSILSDNEARTFVFGAVNYLTTPARPVAVKTGTTNDFRDGWTIGYTPSLVAGVWVGNNNNAEMSGKADGSNIAAPIWQEFMIKALGTPASGKATPIETFREPEPIQVEKPILKGETPGLIKIKIDKASGRLATEYTPESYVIEKTYHDTHSILHYVNKDDPGGPLPENPVSDPQYENWEAAIQKWAFAQGFETAEQPPIEYDNLHLPEYWPSIKITSPANNQTLYTRNLKTEIETKAVRGIFRVEYYLDNELISTTATYPFQLEQALPTSIENGFHILKVVAYDDIDNSGSAEINFNLLAD